MTDTGTTEPEPTDDDLLDELAEVAAEILSDIAGATLTELGDNPARQLRPLVEAILVEKHSATMLKRFEEETRIRAMEYRNGATMELDAARDMTAAWVGCARGMLGGSTNYSETAFEFTVKAAEDRDKYTLTVQRHAPGALTPHEARQKAEELLALAHELRIPIFTQHEGYAEVVVERGPGPHRGMFGVTDGAAHLRSTWVEGEGWKPIRDVGPAATYRHTMAAAVDLARHVAAMEAATPRPAGQPAAAASHHREQDRAEGRAQVIAELRTRATGPMLLRVLDEVAEMFARPSEPARCCMCGSAAVRYRNYREQPFCWPCADGTSPQAKAQIALSIADLDKPARSGGSQDGDHECNGRRPAPEPPPQET